jgi:pimeloyl-ACP methyl ester carboxylesterase
MVKNELQMHTASPGNAVPLETAFYDDDFAEIARQVAVPTLVLHCRDDMATPYNEGRPLAGLIPMRVGHAREPEPHPDRR